MTDQEARAELEGMWFYRNGTQEQRMAIEHAIDILKERIRLKEQRFLKRLQAQGKQLHRDGTVS